MSKSSAMYFCFVLGLAIALWIYTTSDTAGPTSPAPAAEQTSKTRRLSGSQLRLPSPTQNPNRPDTAAITGQVTNAPKGPIHVVLFSMVGETEHPVRHSGQNSSGDFAFTALPAGTYCVVATAANSQGSTCRIRLRQSERVEIAISMDSAGRTVHGTVYDAGGGTVPDPQIMAQRYPDFQDIRFATGGEAGAYTLPLAEGRYRLTALAEGYSAVDGYVDLQGVVTKVQRDFRLNPAASIHGMVTYATGPNQGNPVAAATVTATGRSQVPQSTTTASDGSYTIANLRSNDYDIVASLQAQSSDVYTLAIALGEDHKRNLQLHRGHGTLKGIITDAKTQQPIAGAVVSLAGANRDAQTTDASGTYQFTDLRASSLTVQAYAQNYPTQSARVIVGDTEVTTKNLQLQPGVPLRGIVRAISGEPVPGAQVELGMSWEKDTRLHGQSTNAAGAFFFQAVPVGSVDITAFHEDHGLTPTQSLQLASGQVRRIELIFEAQANISGVLRFDDGSPTPFSTVTLASGEASYRAGTNATGFYEFPHLAAGIYRLSGHPPGNATPQMTQSDASNQRVDLAAGEHKTVDLVVPGGNAEIAGTVVDSEGHPVSGAAIWVERHSDKLLSGTALSDVRTFTWDDGSFSIQGVPRGQFTLYANHIEHGSGKVDDISSGQTDAVVPLQSPAKISGTVLLSTGKPATNFQLRWTVLDRSVQGSQSFRNHHRMFRSAQGAFSIGVPPSELIRLRAESPKGEIGHAKDIAITSGAHKNNIQIRLQGLGTVTGTIVDSTTEKPGVGILLYLPNGQVPLANNGTFSAKVPAGTYEEIATGKVSGNRTVALPAIQKHFVVEVGKTTDLGVIAAPLSPQ